MNPQSSEMPIQTVPNSSVSEPREEGYLIVHVTTARGAIPLEGALVTLRDYSSEISDRRGDTLFTTVSGRDGNTVRLTLPAPTQSTSLTPGNKQPFSVYNLEVALDGYRGQTYIGLPIFSGITAIQPVDLIPLSENGRDEIQRPEDDRFYETEPEDL